MSRFGVTRVTSITSDTAATTATQLVRLGELTTALAAHTPNTHTHVSSTITDLTTVTAATIAGLQTDSASIAWDGTLTASVVLATGSGLSLTGGLGANFGTSAGQVAEGNHTHAQLHAPVTLVDSYSIAFAMTGQEISAAALMATGKGLEVTAGGIGCVFGSTSTTVAVGNHTHAQLHDALTVVDTYDINFTLTGQQLSGTLTLLAATTGYAAIERVALGLRIPMDATNQPASHGHTHAAATSSTAGFLSSADKRKLDGYEALVQQEMVLPYYKSDALMQAAYVGGKAKFGQNMQLTGADLVCAAPQAATTLAIEVAGVLVQRGLIVPTGLDNSESSATWAFTNLFVSAGDYIRVYCESGVQVAEDIADAPSQITFNMNVRPSIGTVPGFQINCGGTASGDWVEDFGYDLGNTGATFSPIDSSGVLNPAPDVVYQTIRAKYADSRPLTYTITGLAKGIDYKVRLHFCAFFDVIGDEKFDIDIIGSTTDSTIGYDPVDQGGGQYHASVHEATLKASSEGSFQIVFTPILATDGTYNCSINGIEILEL